MRTISFLITCAVGSAAIAPLLRTSPPTDPVAKLITDVQSGRLKLAYEPKRGYLDAVLRELNISDTSQVLVFSKTSLQTDFITRKTPRAFYFNKDTYVGWIPDAPFLEIATVDPTRGVIFYTLRNERSKSPIFDVEPRDCTRCHGRRNSYRTPELFVESVYTSPAGYSRAFAPAIRVSPETPLHRRWGGWYVTGTHGTQRHMGNEIAEGTDESYKIDTEKGANLTSLRKFFDPTRYRTGQSDIVALMTLEHQLQVQNAIARLAVSDSAVEPLVEALLFSDHRYYEVCGDLHCRIPQGSPWPLARRLRPQNAPTQISLQPDDLLLDLPGPRPEGPKPRLQTVG